jgi:transposase-like protein
MPKVSYSGYRFPPEIIHQAIWLYLRFTLSFRDVEDSLTERGIAISYETVRRWVNHFGPIIAAELRKRRPKPHATWHLDEVYLKIDGRMVYLWRAVDAEGEVLDVLVQSKRDKRAALKLMRKLLRKYAVVPERLVTDDLRSYRAATSISASTTCTTADDGVESTTGAVAVGTEEWLFAGSFRTLPVPQFGPWLRFQSPLVKPDVRISRIRLSPVPSNLRSWQVAAVSRDGVEAERLIKILVRDLVEPGAFASRSP